jgi:hypothetical protein
LFDIGIGASGCEPKKARSSQAHPRAYRGAAARRTTVDVLVSRIFASWNQIALWLRQLDNLRQSA